MKLILFALAALGLSTSCLAMASHRAAPGKSAPRPSCSTRAAADEVSATIRAFFESLAKDDDAAVARLTSPDFYAFDVGKLYTAPSLSAAIADAHKAGRTIRWNIGPVTSRIDCNLASATWENNGAAGIAPDLQPRAWLESATLVRRDGRWVIHFLHSTPKTPSN